MRIITDVWPDAIRHERKTRANGLHRVPTAWIGRPASKRETTKSIFEICKYSSLAKVFLVDGLHIRRSNWESDGISRVSMQSAKYCLFPEEMEWRRLQYSGDKWSRSINIVRKWIFPLLPGYHRKNRKRAAKERRYPSVMAMAQNKKTGEKDI